MMADVRYVECDPDLARRAGEAMGPVAERHIRLADGFAWVALAALAPVGLIAVYQRPLPPPLAGVDEGFINIIEVIPACRRQGIGSRLVALSRERCRAEGWYQLRAWSSDDKVEAIALWRALSFTLCPATEHPRGLEVHGHFAAQILGS
jgi:GNAT superfamily N-acetyltransferase